MGNRRYEENLQLVNDICGHNSIEAVLSIFQVADLHSRQGLHLKVSRTRTRTHSPKLNKFLRNWEGRRSS